MYVYVIHYLDEFSRELHSISRQSRCEDFQVTWPLWFALLSCSTSNALVLARDVGNRTIGRLVCAFKTQSPTSLLFGMFGFFSSPPGPGLYQPGHLTENRVGVKINRFLARAAWRVCVGMYSYSYGAVKEGQEDLVRPRG